MYRSFTDRIFGGVCGGLAADLHVNVWWLRTVFLVLAILTQGAAALVYVALWWVLPQESLIIDRRRSIQRAALVAGIVVLLIGLWVGHQGGWLVASSGDSLFVPAVVLAMSTIFLLRQLGR